MRIVPRKTNIRLLYRRPGVLLRKYWWPFAVLLAGAVADAWTTYSLVALYGPEVETHVVQRWCSELLGVTAGVPLAKLGQVAFVLLVAAWWRRWTTLILILCGLLYALAACSNYFLWF